MTFHSSNSWLGFVLAIRLVLKKILGFFSWQKKDKFSCTIFSAVIMNEWLKYKRATQEQNTLDWNEHTNSHLLTKILLNYIRVEFYWKLIFFSFYLSLYYPTWAILSYMYYTILWASQVVLVLKNLPTNTGDIRVESSTHGSGRSPGGGHGNPPQYFCLENPMDRGAWQGP